MRAGSFAVGYQPNSNNIDTVIEGNKTTAHAGELPALGIAGGKARSGRIVARGNRVGAVLVGDLAVELTLSDNVTAAGGPAPDGRLIGSCPHFRDVTAHDGSGRRTRPVSKTCQAVDEGAPPDRDLYGAGDASGNDLPYSPPPMPKRSALANLAF